MGRIARLATACSMLATTAVGVAVAISHSATAITGLVLPENTDITFGITGPTPGTVAVPLPTGDNGSISSILPQPDGSLIVGGELQSGTVPRGFWLAHVMYDGTLDPSFGAGGVSTAQTWTNPTAFTRANPPTLVQANGRIIVASDNDTGFERLYGLTAQGVIDPTFGGGGTGHRDLTGYLSNDGSRVITDSLQRLYVVTIDTHVPSLGVAIIRLSPDGATDGTYPTVGGTETLPHDGTQPSSARAAFTADGRLVVLYQGPGFTTNHALALVRLLGDGSVDPTFAPGFPTDHIKPVPSAQQPNDLRIAADGKLLLAYSFTNVSGGAVSSVEEWAPDGSSGFGRQMLGSAPAVPARAGGGLFAINSAPVDAQVGPFDTIVTSYQSGLFSSDPVFNATSATPGVATIPATTPPIIITAATTDAVGNLVLGGETRPGLPHGTPWLTRMLTGPKPFAVNSPSRLVDTRPDGVTVDGLYARIGPIRLSGTIEVRVTGRGHIAPDATAVVLNVTVVNPKADGFITVFPCPGLVPNGFQPPTSSNLNYKAGQTISNAVITKVGFDPILGYGQVCFHTLRTTDLVVDGGNYFPPVSTFSGVGPARLMDTRPGQPTVDGQYAGIGIRDAGSVTALQVTGRGGVPLGASAVVLNVTSTESTAPGFVTVYPCDAARPNSSNVNFSAGDTIPNLVITKLSASGTVCLYTHASTQLLVDVSGAFAGPGTFLSLVPTRLMETRPSLTTIDNQYNGIGLRGAGTVTELQVTGRGGVPTGVAAAVLNVTVTEPTADGFVTVFPCDGQRPNSSNVNYIAGQTIPNAVVAKLSPNGTVCLYTHTSTQLVVDVSGYFPLG